MPEPSQYRIARDGQTFGPYTEDEVRQYLASGNLVEGDLACLDGMNKWQPLIKLLPKKKKEKPPKKSLLDPAGLRASIPSPPDMPWVMAAALAFFTSFTFLVAWDVVEAAWLYRVEKRSRAIWYYALAALFFLLNARAFYTKIKHIDIFGPFSYATHATYLTLGLVVMIFIARFSMRASLLQHFNTTEPIGLRLSWFWTLIFGGLYFQFHFNRINELKRSLTTTPA